MYQDAIDEQQFLYVCKMTVPGSQDDFDQHVQRLRELLAKWCKSPKTPAFFIYLAAGHEMPDALRRKAVADTFNQCERMPHVAICTENPLVRSVMLAVQWMRRAEVDERAVRNFAEGRAWLEGKRGESLPGLETLFATMGGNGKSLR